MHRRSAREEHHFYNGKYAYKRHVAFLAFFVYIVKMQAIACRNIELVVKSFSYTSKMTFEA